MGLPRAEFCPNSTFCSCTDVLSFGPVLEGWWCVLTRLSLSWVSGEFSEACRGESVCFQLELKSLNCLWQKAWFLFRQTHRWKQLCPSISLSLSNSRWRSGSGEMKSYNRTVAESLKHIVWKNKQRFLSFTFHMPNSQAYPTSVSFLQGCTEAINYLFLYIQGNNWGNCTHR